jgi:hypothetical protein
VRRFSELRALGPGLPDDPVFADLKGKLLKKEQVADWVAQCRHRLGDPKLRFSAKSIRAGSATATVELGMPEATTKALGAWKSDAYQRYARVERHTISKAVSAMVGMTPAAPAPLSASPPPRGSSARRPGRKRKQNRKFAY